MRQSVKLMGLGAPLFQDCIGNIQRLSQILSRQVPEGNMDLFQHSNFLEYPALDIGTRYFTSRRDDPVGPSAPFDSSVDPKGILASIVDDKYFYGPDNIVLYYLAHKKTQDDPIRWRLYKNKECHTILTNLNQIQKNRSCMIQDRRYSRSSNNCDGSSDKKGTHQDGASLKVTRAFDWFIYRGEIIVCHGSR